MRGWRVKDVKDIYYHFQIHEEDLEVEVLEGINEEVVRLFMKYKEDIMIKILKEVRERIKVHLVGFIWGIKEYYHKCNFLKLTI